MTVKSASEILRNYETDGVPASGAHQVIKADLRDLLTQLQTLTGAGASLAYTTLANLNGDLLHGANTLAYVYGDSTSANNGSYIKVGASGSGSWSRIADLPNAIVKLTVTGGTGNAITATATETPQTPGIKLYVITPSSNNTSATTIAVDGASAVAITNAFGAALASGSLISGNPAVMLRSSTSSAFQLLIAAAVDGNAILASAQAAAVTATNAATSMLATMLTATANGVTGDGSTNDASAINTFLTLAQTNGAIAYFPGGGKIYDLGSSNITVPDKVRVSCAPDAKFRRSTITAPFPGAMVNMGNDCRWSGGILDNTAVVGTSATSKAIATGTGITFTTQSSVAAFTIGQFCRFESRANRANHMEGTVTAYSGTTLTMTISFLAGSGTFTDWDIFIVSNSAMILHNVQRTIVEGVRLTGNWYVGFNVEAINGSGGTFITRFCTLRSCYVEGAQNRAYYISGTCNDNLIEDCHFDGQTGKTDYGVNLNPSNPSGQSYNGQNRNKIANCTGFGTAFQGYEAGDLCDSNTFIDCTITSMTDSTAVGFLIQSANANTPTSNIIVGCHALNCPGEGFYFTGAAYGGVYSSKAHGCGNGFQVSGCNYVSVQGVDSKFNTGKGIYFTASSAECDALNIKSFSNTGVGVQVDAGCTNTLLSGRTVSNTGANLTDNGTGTGHSNLVTT